MSTAPSGVLVVTGTGTGVGKTTVTAAVAALCVAAGRSVAVVKAAQTGAVAGEPADVEEIRRLTGLKAQAVRELARYPLALAPATAARLSGLAPLDLDECAGVVQDLARSHDLVLVEGAGGLLVRLADGELGRRTLADLAASLGAAVLVVAEPGLGTLNHTTLTVEALAARELTCAAVVLGHWPADPDLACRSNIGDLEAVLGAPLGGALPEHMGLLAPRQFRAAAAGALGPGLGGTFDAADFRRKHAP